MLKEIKTSRIASTATNPRSDTNDIQNPQLSGSKGNRSIGVDASRTVDSELQDDSHPLRASDMNDLRNPAKPFCQNEFYLKRNKDFK